MNKKKFFINFILGSIVILTYLSIYRVSMWNFQFFAPQYPQGLFLHVQLNGVQGDTSEIDIINHYIGMAKLADAAQMERKLAPYALGSLCFIGLLLIFIPLKKGMFKILGFPILMFPLGFLVIFFAWLYKFGHDLNPLAPVELAPFTPRILGTGIIGQFRTFATPGAGFYLACFLSILIYSIYKYKFKNLK